MADDEATPRIVSRKEAEENGFTHYFTGKPCKRGHIEKRYTKYGACVGCARINLCASRARNPERTLAKDREWKNKNREKMRAKYRERYAANKEKYINKTKKYYQKNSEKVRARRRAYHYSVYVQSEVREKAQERIRQGLKENPDRARVNARNSKARRKAREGVVVGSHTVEDIADILRRQNERCAYCTKHLRGKHHVDHIIPLARGGTNDRRNLQILCPRCNLEKHSRDPLFYARSLGLLL